MSKLEFITEGMLFKIRQHQQELPEALRRAALADYREGVFSITINTRTAAHCLVSFAMVNSIPQKWGKPWQSAGRKFPNIILKPSSSSIR